jgi:hypothetical protein
MIPVQPGSAGAIASGSGSQLPVVVGSSAASALNKPAACSSSVEKERDDAALPELPEELPEEVLSGPSNPGKVSRFDRMPSDVCMDGAYGLETPAGCTRVIAPPLAQAYADSRRRLSGEQLLRRYERMSAQLQCAPLNSLNRVLPVFAISTRRQEMRREDAASTQNETESLSLAEMGSSPRDSVNEPHDNNRSELPADQTARAENAHNFAAECRLAENAAIARAEAAEQRLAALEAQMSALNRASVPADGDPGPSTRVPESDPVDPAPAAAAGANMAELPSALRTALEESTADRTSEQISRFEAALMNVLANTVASQVVRSEPKTRPSDVGLSDFTGASSSSATVIEPEFYPRLLLWLEESEQLLRNSGLSTVEQIRTLFAHLNGAARKQFTTRWRNLDFSTMSMNEAKEKIFALVPNHQTHFTRAAMDMKFKAHRLASDLDRFALYASHGDLPVDGYHFWYRMIQDKLLEACPDLFRLASEHFGKRIEFDPAMAFASMIEHFMDIVLAVQTELKTQLLGEKRSRPFGGAEPKKADKMPKMTHSKPSTAKAVNLNDDFYLARKVGMCFGCGKLYPAAVGKGDKYDKGAHDQVCRKKFVRGVCTDEFKAAIAKWRKLVDAGKSANEINKLANSQRPKAE